MPISGALFIIDCNRSATKTKRRGEIGSPCLTPRRHLKVFPGTPLRRTEVVEVVRISLTQFIQVLVKPLAFSTVRMAECSTESKAFSKSILRIRVSLSL
ncbi:Os02g0499575 [Oryza sativa Japonica Group]|uniref:Os02g0499575 protein n=1 Tax=Oryza sativa subsp. japonica TaxID=39947 RepID=A0A0P0VJB9_ORYSJ|nr:hypothetical protein EE612_011511 [Oryza sativa]BAS78794.1 Os02g0499575 [Oryza sativa Japonica Group]